MNLRAIILDFDGVLADTERLHLGAFQDVLAEDGVELTPADYAARYLGRSDSEVFKTVASDRRLPLHAKRLQSLLARKAARYNALMADGGVLIPGVAARVRSWSAGLPLAVASGARRVEIESVLGSADLLQCFRAIVAAEDVWRGKPSPDPFLLALDRINAARTHKSGVGTTAEGPIEPRMVVAIEDSLTGLQAIEAAGMHAVAVTTNYPPERLAVAELVVQSIADLDLDVLGQLVASGA